MPKARILVVEDDPLAGRYLNDLAEKLGYQVLAITPTGEEAIDLAASEEPDLVLMDIYLAGQMDGIEAARIIKDQRRVPVIFVTGHLNPDLLRRAKTARPDNYLMKPFYPQQLEACLEMTLHQSKLAIKLAESEQRLRLVLEATSDGYWDWNLRTGESFRGRNWSKMLGYQPGEVLDHHEAWRALVHPEDLPAALEAITRHLEGETETYQAEFRMRNKNGQWQWLLTRGRVVEWDHEDPVRMVGTHTDLSQRMQAEEARRRFEFMANSSGDLMSLVNRDYVLEAVNQAYLDALGLEAGELIGRTMAQVWGEDDFMVRIKDHLDRCFAGQEASYEVWLDLPAVGRRCYEIFFYPYSNQQGVVTHVVGVAHDITGRKHAEMALMEANDELEVRVAARTAEAEASNRELQSRLEELNAAQEKLANNQKRLWHLLDNMPVMMNAFDENNVFVSWNQECERVTGYSVAEIIGNPDAFALLYPDPSYLQAMMTEFYRRGANFRNWEWELTCKDGTRKTVAWSNISEKVPIPGWYAWAVGVDVTERKKAERMLTEQAQSLEETNTALKILLKHRDEEKEQVEEGVLASINKLVAPYMGKLAQRGLTAEQKALVEIIELNLKEITSQFTSRLTSKFVGLTPRELEVAGLVKDGKTTSEIAQILYISENSVSFHRRNIRSKLGLNKEKANLRSYLQQLSENK